MACRSSDILRNWMDGWMSEVQPVIMITCDTALFPRTEEHKHSSVSEQYYHEHMLWSGSDHLGRKHHIMEFLIEFLFWVSNLQGKEKCYVMCTVTFSRHYLYLSQP